MSSEKKRLTLWWQPRSLPRSVSVILSCFSLLFNLDDLTKTLSEIHDLSTTLGFLRVLLGCLALGIVGWFPRIGAILIWLSIPISISSDNTATFAFIAPLVGVVVTGTSTLMFTAVNAGVLAITGAIVAQRWSKGGDPSVIISTVVFVLIGCVALGLVLRAILNSRTERRLQEKRIVAIQKQAEEAAEKERQRLAHDMHDYVAHELTVIVAALAAARARRGAFQQSAAQDAALLDTVEQTSRKALDELRRVLRLLDSEEIAEPVVGSPLPISGSHRAIPLETMLTDAAQDLQVIGDKVTISVTPEAAAQDPSAEQRALLQRFLSEAVTNAVKHGGMGSRVTIQASAIPGGLRVSLANTIEKGTAGPDESTGLGIKGLRERAEELHCTLSAEPAPDQGGWIMALDIPEALAA